MTTIHTINPAHTWTWAQTAGIQPFVRLSVNVKLGAAAGTELKVRQAGACISWKVSASTPEAVGP